MKNTIRKTLVILTLITGIIGAIISCTKNNAFEVSDIHPDDRLELVFNASGEEFPAQGGLLIVDTTVDGKTYLSQIDDIETLIADETYLVNLHGQQLLITYNSEIAKRLVRVHDLTVSNIIPQDSHNIYWFYLDDNTDPYSYFD